MIVEIGFDLKDMKDLERLEELLRKINIAYYVEPPNKFASLEDLECECEGK